VKFKKIIAVLSCGAALFMGAISLASCVKGSDPDDTRTDYPVDDPVIYDPVTDDPITDDPVTESAHTHSATKIEAVASTCTAYGSIEYWYCSSCGKYFADEACSKEISVIEAVLEKTAHSYKDGFCSVCGEEDPDYVPPTPSEGLSYALSSDGTYYVLSGLGSCADTEIVVPSEYEGLPVREIGAYAFCAFDLETFEALGTNILSVTVSDGVAAIGEGAFYGCASLVRVILPDSVSSIGDSAFYECEALARIKMNGVEKIGVGAFYNCASLSDITISESVAVIGDSAFRNCISLASVDIGGGVETIGVNAFAGCSALSGVTISASVTDIGNDSFTGCKALEEITVDEANKNYKSVDGNLYSKDGSVLIKYAAGKAAAEFTVPYGVTKIGDCAFTSSVNLKSVNIASSVTDIGSYAFTWCSLLSSITIPDGVEKIGDSAFKYCYSLTSVVLGEGLVSLGDGAFTYCKALTDMAIPVGVVEIGASAFYNCVSLTGVTFKNASGWTARGKSLSSTDLSDPATAAAYLTDSYCWFSWSRS